MKLLARIIVAVAVNISALWAAATYIPGFTVAADFRPVAIAAIILAALNFALKPILKLVLGPVIILTLGLGLILVNALILFILDKISGNITIETIPALLYGAVFVGLVNFIEHLATKE